MIQSNITNAAFPNAAFGLDFTKPPTQRVQLRSLKYTGTPYVMQYNFNIQSQLFEGTALTVGYLGSQSRKLMISRPVNVNQWCFSPMAVNVIRHRLPERPAWDLNRV